ncbi:hypothetical protein L486_08329 [Kwoniella mangroviensis CBS 10435]|uniref:Uncharacterized protein n=1 Tax=Kwoniella mangroviensis CBS 10435 TaxID=1331196 RepID=A0A1B9IFB5_9TREE|nr:hypothetical protein L486_08329 [Kwoniella mangroviensis CBS 10435]
MSTSYCHTNHHHSPTPTIHHLIQKRANAISSIPFSQTTTTFINSPSPIVAPRGMGIVEVSPTASSPSLYSRVGHSNSPQIYARSQMIKTSRKLQVLSESEMTHRYSVEDEPYHHEEEAEEEEEEDPRRMSMVGGPRVRKYTQVPWEEEDNEAQWSMVTQNPISNHSQAGGVTVVGSADMFSGFNRSKPSTTPSGYGKNIRSTGREREQSTISTTSTIMSNSDSSSLNVSSTRRGLAQILGVTSNKDKDNDHAKHLVPSASGLSLASNQTSSASSTSSFLSDSTPITPKLKSTNAIQIGVSHLPNISDKSDKRIDTFHQGEYENSDASSIGLLPAVIPKSSVLSTYKKPQSPLIDNLTLTPTPGPAGCTANDRPLMNSGSPGFGLITLEAAQERERQKSQSQSQNQSQMRSHETIHTQSSTHSRSTTSISIDQQKRPLTTFSIPPIPDDPNAHVLRPTTSCTSTSSPPNKVKSKKSGLMRLFNKSEKDKSAHSNKPVPALPHTTNSTNANGPTMTPSLKGRDGVSSRAMSIWSSSTATTNENSTSTSTSTGTVHGESAVWPSSSHKKSQGVPTHGGQGVDEEKRQLEVSSSSTLQPKLELRPISMTFSRGLPVDYLVNPQHSYTKRNQPEDDPPIPSVPCTPTSSMTKKKSIPADEEVVDKKKMMNVKKAFTIQIYELEAQIRELKDELKEARARKMLEGNCDKCGCTCNFIQDQDDKDDNILLNVGSNTSGNGNRKVIDRARVKTAGARGVFGSGSLYEWE